MVRPTPSANGQQEPRLVRGFLCPGLLIRVLTRAATTRLGRSVGTAPLVGTWWRVPWPGADAPRGADGDLDHAITLPRAPSSPELREIAHELQASRIRPRTCPARRVRPGRHPAGEHGYGRRRGDRAGRASRAGRGPFTR